MFQPKQQEKNDITGPDWPEATGAAFLAPSKSIEAVRATDPSTADRLEDDARRKTLRALNALRIVGPLLAAIMERDGDGSPEQASADFMQLVSATTKFSEAMAAELDVKPSETKNFWIRNVLERLCAEAIKERWVERGDVNIERLVSAAKVAKDSRVSEGERDFPPMQSDMAVRVAMLKALAIVLSKMDTSFDFFRNLDEEAERVGGMLMRAASEGTLHLADPYAGERDRAALFSVAVEEAGRLYAASWQGVGEKAVGDLSKLSDEALEKVLKLHPEGLPTKRVDEGFERNFKRLMTVTAKLVPPKAGGVAARVRNQP